MLSRSSSLNSTKDSRLQTDGRSHRRNYFESLQNIRTATSNNLNNLITSNRRAMISRLSSFNTNINNENENQNRFSRQSNKKLSNNNENLLPSSIHKSESEPPVETLKMSIIKEDIDSLYQRLEGVHISSSMSTAVAQVDESSNENVSIVTYFTPEMSCTSLPQPNSTDVNQKAINNDLMKEKDQTVDDVDEVESDVGVWQEEGFSHPFFDPLSPSSYELEIISYLLELEQRFSLEVKRLKDEKQQRQTAIHITYPVTKLMVVTPKVRCKLIDWIISVHDYHRLNASILHRTIHLIDRVLLINDAMTKLDLQLTAICCFTIACKLESRRVPPLRTLIVLFDSKYAMNAHQIHMAEKELLRKLDFELEYPLPVHYLCYYLRFLPFSFVIYSMSKYITEVILCNYDLSSWPSSFIAAISLYMALKFTKFLPNNKRVVRKFFARVPYKQDELESKFLTIIDLLKNVNRSAHHSSVREKYKREEFDQVALFDYDVDLEVKIPSPPEKKNET